MELSKLGMGQELLERLQENGFTTIEKLALASSEELARLLSLKLTFARQLVQSARETIALNFRTALEIFEERSNIERISTGSKALDGILGGGVEAGSITEFFGEYGSGKSQLVHQLCVNVQLGKEKGGLSKKAIFVDTEGTFRPERIAQMAEGVGEDPKSLLEGILVVRAYDTDQQMLLARKLGGIAGPEVGLVVVDSITNLFRTEYGGRGTLAERQQRLCRHLADLKRLADLNHLAVVVTNQVLARPEIFFGDPTQPVGGNVLGHAITHRVYLRKGKAETRTATLVDSPNLPCRSASFRIVDRGISD
ncbi:MAG: DNA repair and recombination protein RadA [Candidatus Hadarchaeales archaeon]